MNPDVTPYQLATLAARIGPRLCRGGAEQQASALYSALSLILDSADILEGHIELNKELQERSERKREFCKRYDLKSGYIKYRRAATVITGHAEDRHVTTAVSKFEKFLMEYDDDGFDVDDIFECRDTKPPTRLETLNTYRISGVPLPDVVKWRILAEKSGVCARKLLTGDLRESPAILREVSERNAHRVAKGASQMLKSACGPSKKRGRGCTGQKC